MENKNNFSSKNEANNSMDTMLNTLKTNSDLVKGVIALLFGSYLISIKYYVVIDFLLFAAGFALVLYGLACLKFARIQAFLYGLINRVSQFNNK